MASDIRQSNEFAAFMEDINWRTEKLGGFFVYLRKFPLVGFFAKCPRSSEMVPVSEILEFVKKNRVFRFKISPNISVSAKNYRREKRKFISAGFKIDTDPFNPTTTFRVNLTRPTDKIFDSFRSAKRRGVRRAIKNGVKVEVTDKIDLFIKIRQEQYRPMGFLVTGEMKALWRNFYPKKADLLLARSKEGAYLAGILLLYHGPFAYYWFASSLFSGKKLFAPTLLVWEAIKRVKARGAKYLDFEGVYDERFPKASQNWRGFTKFKEGFSPERVVFMENFTLKSSLI